MEARARRMELLCNILNRTKYSTVGQGREKRDEDTLNGNRLESKHPKNGSRANGHDE
jgi:hypothetical protein